MKIGINQSKLKLRLFGVDSISECHDFRDSPLNNMVKNPESWWIWNLFFDF